MKKVLKNISRVLFSLLLIFSIFGTFNVLAEEVIFKVTNISVKEKSDGVIVNNVSLNSGNITNDIVFTNKDDYIKYNITIKNNSDKDYTIKSISDDNDSANLEYTYDDLSNVVLSANEEKTFELTITYKIDSLSTNISTKKVNLTLTYEDENGNVETSNVEDGSIANPKTGDNIYKYLIMGCISIIGLGITMTNKKKLTKLLMIIGIASKLIIPFGVNAESEKFQIVFNNTIKAKEYTVTFNTNGGTEVNPIKVVKGGKVPKPSNPIKEGYEFDNWYTNSNLSSIFDFEDTSITSDTEIYAKYEISRYSITWKNDNDEVLEIDENVEYGTTPTYDGTIPTKEATAQYTYTFAGWTPSINKVINNITYTAIYSSTLNDYTVTFDTNGGSVVENQTIGYGKKATRPSTNPIKTDYAFEDWYTDNTYTTKFDFANTAITSDTIIYANFIDPCNGFNTDSWSNIVTNLANDSNYYSSTANCRREVPIDMDDDGENESYTVRLVNTSTPEVCNTEGFSQTACGIVIEFLDFVDKRVVNSTQTNVGGWRASELAAWLNSDFYNKLPNDLKSVIIPTYPIVSGNGYYVASPNITEEDTALNKIYLFANKEVGYDHDWDTKKDETTDTRILDFYRENTDKSYKVKRDLSNTAQDWWLRSATSKFYDSFFAINKGGSLCNSKSDYEWHVSPAFRIGNNN